MRKMPRLRKKSKCSIINEICKRIKKKGWLIKSTYCNPKDKQWDIQVYALKSKESTRIDLQISGINLEKNPDDESLVDNIPKGLKKFYSVYPFKKFFKKKEELFEFLESLEKIEKEE